VRLPICDDARQFKLVIEELGLCWIHDGAIAEIRRLAWPIMAALADPIQQR
jgi:hypothetical protein